MADQPTYVLFLLLERDTGTDDSANVAAIGRSREEAIDKWYENAIREAQHDFGENGTDPDPEVLEEFLERANEIDTWLRHTFLYPDEKVWDATFFDHEVEFCWNQWTDATLANEAPFLKVEPRAA